MQRGRGETLPDDGTHSGDGPSSVLYDDARHSQHAQGARTRVRGSFVEEEGKLTSPLTSYFLVTGALRVRYIVSVLERQTSDENLTESKTDEKLRQKLRKARKRLFKFGTHTPKLWQRSKGEGQNVERGKTFLGCTCA